MQNKPSIVFTAPTPNQPPAVVPMAAIAPPANAAAPHAAIQGPQIDGPQIAVDKAKDVADDLEQFNISSASPPDPDLMVRPIKTDGIFFALLVGHANGVAEGENPLAGREQLESHFRQFPTYDQAFGYYMAYFNLGLVRIVAAGPPASPGTDLDPVYIPSNASTPAPVSPGLFGHPISLPATPIAVNLATFKPAANPAIATFKPAANPAIPVKHAAKSTAKPGAKSTAKPAILKQVLSKSPLKAAPSSGASAAAPRPYLLAPPPKPTNLPAPSQKTPTPVNQAASEQSPKKFIHLGTVTVLGSDSESDEFPHIPNYPTAPRLAHASFATPGPIIRPFPAPSPLSSEGVPDTPRPVTPHGKKRFIPLYDDSAFGPTQKKAKAATATANEPTSPSAKGSANRYKIIEAALLKYKQKELETAPSSPSSTRAEATSSTAALTSPLPTASTSTIDPPSVTTFTVYRSVGVMSTSSPLSSKSAATTLASLEMDTDLSEVDSTDLDTMDSTDLDTMTDV
ncbi:hypothetical protein GALMADRAFT_207974 [Galerina marginata CBS 339.88]|uniref:Uncharacterized protein n=1 Tax=Galerina marginata (strain CBS 339.88) TaxID=685588 RepID=A0A067TMI3_GALM3|nr:hypothetical protein GALMADRAFT_207974 [Galerina marginata CBS 339.88]